MTNNRERLADFFAGTVSRTATYQETAEFVTEMIERAEEKTYFAFVVVDTATDALIGFQDLKNIDWSIPKTEVGYFIDKDYSGKGISTKALSLLCDYCFDTHQFKKLFLRTHPANTAAKRVAEKCGFEQEGIIRKDYRTTAGQLVDLAYYGRVR